MKFHQTTGDITTAAMVAIRCLFEDERLFVDTLSRAVEVLLAYTDMIPSFSDSKKSHIKKTLQEYTGALEDTVKHQNHASISEMDSGVITKATGGSGKFSKRFSPKSWSLKQSSGRFVTMEDF